MYKPKNAFKNASNDALLKDDAVQHNLKNWMRRRNFRASAAKSVIAKFKTLGEAKAALAANGCVFQRLKED